MTVMETIIEHLKALPESKQAQVLEFVEFLEARAESRNDAQQDADWSNWSLAMAMRGLEDEETPYTAEDLKEVF